ncbi:MAG: autotransporter outer membrane beta-barrel domain-containing protein, partial [Hyphomicrobiales bacterium]|nr:autotransporter outer membrane beta-barrel domain-containing protein [Hyphomicrobiales bacterium]
PGSATSKPSGQSYQGHAEAGYHWLLPAGGVNVSVTPYAALDYVNAHVDGFSETGGFGAFTVNSADTNSFQTTLPYERELIPGRRLRGLGQRSLLCAWKRGGELQRFFDRAPAHALRASRRGELVSFGPELSWPRGGGIPLGAAGRRRECLGHAFPRPGLCERSCRRLHRNGRLRRAFGECDGLELLPDDARRPPHLAHRDGERRLRPRASRRLDSRVARRLAKLHGDTGRGARKLVQLDRDCVRARRGAHRGGFQPRALARREGVRRLRWPPRRAAPGARDLGRVEGEVLAPARSEREGAKLFCPRGTGECALLFSRRCPLHHATACA